MTHIHRRNLMASAALIAALPMFRASPALAKAAKRSFGVGLAQEPGALIMKLQQEKLIEQAKKELGAAMCAASRCGRLHPGT
jgi:hypothetical protein